MVVEQKVQAAIKEKKVAYKIWHQTHLKSYWQWLQNVKVDGQANSGGSQG